MTDESMARGSIDRGGRNRRTRTATPSGVTPITGAAGARGAEPASARRAVRSPRAAIGLRADLLRLDARELGRVQEQIGGLLAPETPRLQRYRRIYERSLSRGGRPIERRGLLRAAGRAEAILVGDYHTLPEAQRAALELASDLARERPLVLGLEMVAADRQAALDAYMEGRYGDREFLDAIDYATSWPFPWAHYRPLLEAARQGGWTVLGIDGSGGTLARDRRAARVVADSLERRPDAAHLVLVGDLHLAPAHLPRQLLVARPDTRMVVVHQNEPLVYYDLVRRRLDLRAQTVLLGPGRFCLLNATPLRRERSYLAWIESRWGEGRADPLVDLAVTAERLAELLEVDPPRLDWVLASGEELSFLAELETRGAGSERLARVRREIVERNRVLIGELGLLYARTPSEDDIAELAMQVIQEQAGEPYLEEITVNGELDRGRRQAVEIQLLAGVRREALAFLASCLLHPFRAQGLNDALAYQAGEGRGAVLHARELVAALEARVARRRPLRVQPKILDLRPAELWTVAVVAGHLLGHRLFTAMVKGEADRARIRSLLAPPARKHRRERERRAVIELATLAFSSNA
jgi:hypothetical protein